jgi:hypothetical protein
MKDAMWIQIFSVTCCRCLQVIDEMIELGVRPSSVLFSQVMIIFGGNLKRLSFHLSMNLHRQVINACSIVEPPLLEEAQRVLAYMRTQNIQPEESTFTAFIRVHVASGVAQTHIPRRHPPFAMSPGTKSIGTHSVGSERLLAVPRDLSFSIPSCGTPRHPARSPSPR